MKILFFLVVLTNVVLFMWEYKYGEFEESIKTFQQRSKEQILLVCELKPKRVVSNEPVTDIDFTALYPQGLDPLANNLLTEQFILKDFIGEFLFSKEPKE